MEVTSVLAQKGIETTMVLPDDRIWKRFFTAPMSQFFEKYYTERGVRFAKNTKVVELNGAGAVESAVLQNGEILRLRYGRGRHWGNSGHRATDQQRN